MKIKQLFSKWFKKLIEDNQTHLGPVTFKDLGIEQEGKINWEVTGLLKGLNKEEILFTLKYLDQIDFDNIKKDTTKNYIAPIIIRICLSVYHRKYQLYSIRDKGISQKRIIKLINIEEILKEFEIYQDEYMPIVNKYLPHVVREATPEMIKFFCENYVFGLVDKIS